jgi:hypothetical protein
MISLLAEIQPLMVGDLAIKKTLKDGICLDVLQIVSINKDNIAQVKWIANCDSGRYTPKEPELIRTYFYDLLDLILFKKP